MEHVLLKLARQLDAFDEASLLSMWEKYAEEVAHFEPTRRWEEAALVLSLIQAKRWKNQLFNSHLASRQRPAAGSSSGPELMPGFAHELETPRNAGAERGATESDRRATVESAKKRAKVLSFRPREGD